MAMIVDSWSIVFNVQRNEVEYQVTFEFEPNELGEITPSYSVILQETEEPLLDDDELIDSIVDECRAEYDKSIIMP